MTQKEFERKCIAINNRLREPGEATQKRIAAKIFPAGLISRSYRRRRVQYCSECGSEIGVPTQGVCPHCGARWTAEPEEWETRQSDYHMVMEAKGDIQVCRIYRADRYTHIYKKVRMYVAEVERIMYAPTGERRVFAKSIQGMSYYYDAFSWGSSITLKREGKGMSWSATMRYNLTVAGYTIRSLTEQWQHKEIPALMNRWENNTSVLRVIAYPWGETLAKTGQVKLFSYLVREKELLPRGMEHALNICTRNHYEISDPTMWLDHIAMLRQFGLDTHNAYYVCPKDLRAAHQLLVDRRNRERVKREAEQRARRYAERLQQMGQEKANYQQQWGKMLSLQLTAKNLDIQPLHTVDEFAAEGAAMHHCVFENGYYKSKTNLILSAKDDEGHRLATIEYNIGTGSIKQCRAACNAVPERDAEIRTLITSHRQDFKRLMKAA